MSDSDDTPNERPIPVRIVCPHCRRDDVRVMPSGLFEIHAIDERYSRHMCRGGGQPATRR